MSKPKVVALVGAPNSGKTSLFARLTGLHVRAVNYPGATVDFSVGELSESIKVIDTPGTYSLIPKSQEESITRKLLDGDSPLGHLDAVVVVVDATQLGRHIPLAKQIQESGFPVLIALTMGDLLLKSCVTIDTDGLSGELGIKVIPINSLKKEGLQTLQTEIAQLVNLASKKTPSTIRPWSSNRLKEESVRCILLSKKFLHWQKGTSQPLGHKSRQLDKVIMHPVGGLAIFFSIMALLFTSVFWLAAPLMDSIDQLFSWIIDSILQAYPDALWADLLANGLIAGFGAALVFVPQIAILFFGINLLEDSGYLARAATLIDYPLRKMGLSGRSFVPLLSGYACAIPAMMAARTIPNRRERLLTLLIIPLMSCSARLPVFSLLLAFLFWDQAAWKAGLGLTLLYFLSLIVGAVISSVLSRLLKNSEKSFFLMELPWYRKPEWPAVFQNVYLRTRSYVVAAAPLIALFSVGLWAATSFPRIETSDSRTQLEASYAGSLGQFIEPIMTPMGGDWRTGVSLISAFAAREVFVASLAVTLRSEDEEDVEGLVETMRATQKASGAPLFTPASAVALMIFFLIALQCMATVGIARREFGNWRWPMVQLVGFNGLAWILAVLVYKALNQFGVS